LVARWQLKWEVRALLHSIIAGAKRLPGDFDKGYFEACGALAGLVVSDNLLGLTMIPYANHIAVVIGTLVTLIGFIFRHRSWARGYRMRVFRALAWMFGAMGLIVLGVGAERILFMFQGLAVVSNVGVAIYLVAAIVLPTPLFMLAHWARDSEKDVESKLQRQKRVSSVFSGICL